MTATNIILLLFALSPIVFFLTRINKFFGTLVNLLGIISALTVFLYKGSNISEGTGYGFLKFEISHFSWFFMVIILFVYAMAAFYNFFETKKVMFPGAYNMLYTLSLVGTLGVFMAKDFLVLFIFWEIAVWASMFIIPFGKSRNAAVVYYTMSIVGSFVMLYSIFMFYVNFKTFNIASILERLSEHPMVALAGFIMILVAGIMKLGIFPFHIWLPMAQGNSPDSYSAILSGGIEKMGAFLSILVVTAFPAYKAFENQYTIMGMPALIYALMWIAAISIIVGTLLAIRQDDMKILLAYSSLANGGYILLGILMNDKMSVSGSLIHVFVHALASTAAFLVVAAISHRTGTTKMSELGGLAHKMPITFLVYVISILSIAGVPPVIGFTSKWLLFQSLASNGLYFLSIAAFFGSVGSFLYVFRPLMAVFLGQTGSKHKDIKEAPAGMLIPMLILSLVTLLGGIFPTVLVNYTAKIEESLGFSNVIETSGFSIIGTNGNLNGTLISIMFLVGFVIALIIFKLAPKSRKVDLMDTYTAGEFIHTPDLYHYGSDFYAPLERLYEKHPDITGWYERISVRIKEIGSAIESFIFSYLPNRGVLLTIIAIIILLWGEKLWK